VAQAKKHVVIEKPCAITLESLKAQHLAVKDNGVKSLVGFVLRFNPLLQAIDSVIEKGSLGNIFAVEVDYLHRIWMDRNEKWYANKDQSGTALLLAGCHAIDALRWFSRSEVQEVTAYHLNTENPLEFPGTISVNAKFADGKIGRSLTSFDLNMPYRFNIGVYGTRGAIRNDEMFLPDTFKGQNDFLKLPCALPDSGDVTHHPFTGQASYFIDSIINDTPVSIDMADAYKTHLVCMAADISAQQNGKPVKISDLL
jgi:predicted dehydrogenase